MEARFCALGLEGFWGLGRQGFSRNQLSAVSKLTASYLAEDLAAAFQLLCTGMTDVDGTRIAVALERTCQCSLWQIYGPSCNTVWCLVRNGEWPYSGPYIIPITHSPIPY